MSPCEFSMQIAGQFMWLCSWNHSQDYTQSQRPHQQIHHTGSYEDIRFKSESAKDQSCRVESRETNGGFMFYWEIDLVIEQTSSKDTEFLFSIWYKWGLWLVWKISRLRLWARKMVHIYYYIASSTCSSPEQTWFIYMTQKLWKWNIGKKESI